MRSGAGDSMWFPGRATLSAPKGDRPIHEMRPSGAAPTSPPKGVLRHMRHQELWRAVGTHYGPTRIYGPTGHAIGGTAQQALRSFYHSYAALSVTTTGRQRSVGGWTSPPPREPARLASVDYGPPTQLVDEGRSDAVRRDQRLRNRRERADASVQEHGTQSAVQANSTRHALGIHYSD